MHQYKHGIERCNPFRRTEKTKVSNQYKFGRWIHDPLFTTEDDQANAQSKGGDNAFASRQNKTEHRDTQKAKRYSSNIEGHKNRIQPQATDYWFDRKIHTLGNTGLGGGLHAAIAPVSTRVIDRMAYDGVNVRQLVSRKLYEFFTKVVHTCLTYAAELVCLLERSRQPFVMQRKSSASIHPPK